MSRPLVTCLAVFAGLAQWANPAAAGLFCATGPAIAMLAAAPLADKAGGSFCDTGAAPAGPGMKLSPNPALALAGQNPMFGYSGQTVPVILRAANTIALVHQVVGAPMQAGLAPSLIAAPPGPAPDVLLGAATATVAATLKETRNLRADSPEKIDELVASTILPLFNFAHMTERAVAFNWRLATPEQKDALIAEFKTVLVRNYSMALASSRDGVIEYKPLRIAPGQTEATVKSIVRPPTGDGLSIDYDMEKTASGWKAYDIRIAGISLVTNYRASFAHSIREGGVDGLISSLAVGNRQADPGPKPREAAAGGLLMMFSVIRRFFLLGDR
jgi:phospholipid transport system substrate-binding protein